MSETRSLQERIVLGVLNPVKGFSTAGVYAGLRRKEKLDFSIILSGQDCAAAGVFTTNQVKAAPVLLNMAHIQNKPSGIRAIVTNAAVANACTGEQGMQNAQHTAQIAAESLGIEAEQVLVLSTGVIGVQLPMEKMRNGVNLACNALAATAWEQTAHAIMTTDTRPKAVSIVSDAGYTITGIAKGSGMIAPNMATMLSIIVTDADIPQPSLQTMLKTASDVSFNRISVDGDTSTNDTVLLLANGASGVTPYETQFQAELNTLCTQLAHMIVLDGEGATKFITIRVTGASTEADASAIANTIATSSLVKTAFYGSDANWGRILAAAGRAGITLDQSQLQLWFSAAMLDANPLQVVHAGTPTNYVEADASAIFAEQDITLHLDIGQGNAEVTVWTCDLSHEYVSINADYRT